MARYEGAAVLHIPRDLLQAQGGYGSWTGPDSYFMVANILEWDSQTLGSLLYTVSGAAENKATGRMDVEKRTGIQRKPEC